MTLEKDLRGSFRSGREWLTAYAGTAGKGRERHVKVYERGCQGFWRGRGVRMGNRSGEVSGGGGDPRMQREGGGLEEVGNDRCFWRRWRGK